VLEVCPVHFKNKPSALHVRHRIKKHIQSLVGIHLAEERETIALFARAQFARWQLRLLGLPILDNDDLGRWDAPIDIALTQELRRRDELVHEVEVPLELVLAQPEILGTAIRKALMAL